MKISKRLQQISALIPKASRIADIGSDHAFVPIMAVETGCSSFAIASEVAPGPLGISQQNIQAAGLSDKIQTRLGDGLAAIQVEDRIDTFIIAGMGGELIVHILAAADPALLKATHLILEPNNN